MRHFKSARIRLTAWYLLIATFVALLFSIFIYRNVATELEQSFQSAEYRLHQSPSVFASRRAAVLTLLADDLEKAKHLVFLRLLAIDGFIVSVSGIAGYLLAGKILRPIETAVLEQKRFVSDASHELRTPLTVMKSEIEVALRDKSLDTKDSRQLLRSNLEEVDKMQKLTNYLLALNRYESGGMKLTKQRINLAQIAEGIIDKQQKFAKERKVKLSSKLKETYILANETSIEELLSILVDNAIKYTPSGGKITVEVKPSKKRAFIRVTDTGIGIKASDIPYIFNRFYRADTARSKHQTDGYGLGLSIAHSIVQMHKGNIDVQSFQGQGTTFTIVI